eukprot:gnl/TRDRNA2_/TRDRNA2_201065_c0_seq1.p1 gnl/TRDRNA2_/TRDRNA2_201065_c0~~gnl/TRDRNA2_/TRDRNA2_201065_c0_seq1.p1  ORF type:complete len:214 (-),score=25.25 gnl/TRDRNA2_/TRDRNA2_201065_c0_seq1:323-964(-)
MSLNLYHYTSHRNADLILASQIIRCSTGQNGRDAAAGAGVYLTSLREGTSDAQLAMNNWAVTAAGDRLDVAIKFTFPTELIGRKIIDCRNQLQRDVWRFTETIYLSIVPYEVFVRHADGRWDPVTTGVATGTALGVASGVAAATLVTVPQAGIWGLLGFTRAAGFALGGPVGLGVGIVGTLAAIAYAERAQHPAPAPVSDPGPASAPAAHGQQ